MGIINKNANIYDINGKLLEKAPIKNKYRGVAPRQTKYPGSNIAPNIFV